MSDEDTGTSPVAPTPDELVRVIALDGPAGSGKSTVARLVAQALGWRFVDTGATYRAVTLAVLRAGADPEDAAETAAAALAARVELVTDSSAPGVLLDGADVSREIRGAEVTAHVSAVSAVPAVRRRLVELQRLAMGVDGAVVEGRDIATVVAPRAAVKVYLDARPEVRAARRAGEVVQPGEGPRAGRLDEGGEGVDEPGGGRSLRAGAPGASRPGRPAAALLDAVARDLERRDSRDNQTNALQVSEGAMHLDTSDLTLEEVVAAVVAIARDAGLVPA